jgi:hypothetical protein
MKVLSIKPSDRENSAKCVNEIVSTFEQSQNYSRLTSQLSFLDSQTGFEKPIGAQQQHQLSVYKCNYWTQMKWLFWRNGLALSRDPTLCTVYIIQAIVCLVSN